MMPITLSDKGHPVVQATGYETDPCETPIKRPCSGPSETSPITTVDRSPHDKDEQAGRQLAARIPRGSMATLSEKRPRAAENIIINLHPSPTCLENYNEVPVFELVKNKLGEAKALGLLKVMCEKLGMPAPESLREGCLELIFESMTPEQAQATLLAFRSGQLKQKLSEILLACLGENADKYHLDVHIAEAELETIAARKQATGLLPTHDWSQLHTSHNLVDTAITEVPEKNYETITFPISSISQYHAFVSGKLVSGVPSVKSCPLQYVPNQVPKNIVGKCSDKSLLSVVKVMYRVTHKVSESQVLSKAALTELQDIDQKLTEDTSPENDVEKFLKKFGSHARGGERQLCKAFSWMVLSEDGLDGTLVAEIAEDIFTVCEENPTFFPASADGIWYHVTNLLETKSWSKQKKEALEGVKIRVAHSGSSATRLTFQEWKDISGVSLPKCHHNIGESLTPFWDLLDARKSEFRHGDSLVSALRDGWIRLLTSTQHQTISMPNDLQSIHIPQLDTWRSVVQDLGMEQFLPCKLQLQAIRSLSINEEKAPGKKQLAWRVLEQLMLMNPHCRDENVAQYAATVNRKPAMKFGQAQAQQAESQKEVPEAIPHPMDLMLLLFTCSDFMLRQILAHKLFMCRLAIPFIIPTSDSTLHMLLWPLRSIVMEWRNEQQKPMEEALVKCECNIITFMRYGVTAVSKSKMINSILSPSEHGTFFNKESSIGNEKRRISNGMVELSHYLPAGSSKDRFTQPALFFNLRGDACDHPQQQRFMTDHATVIVIFIDIGELETSTVQQVLQETMKKKKHVVVVLTDAKGHDKENIEELQHIFSKVVSDAIDEIEVVTTFEIEKSGEAKIITSVRNEVEQAILIKMSKNATLSLEDAVAASTIKCDVDEVMNEYCRAGKECADDIMSKITAVDIKSRRETLLPQQGDHLYEIGTLLRKLHRSTGSSLLEKDKCKEELLSLRKKQSESSSKYPLMENVINMFLEHSDKSAFAIRWLQLELDGISRRIFPQLHKEKNQKWNELMKAQTADNVSLVESLETQIRKVERQIASATFGLEHLVREMAQLYEVAADLKCLGERSKYDLHSLPDIVSHLLVEGYPVELMDGDHGFIPIEWIKAVFHSLVKIVGHDKKIFVLSVMGIQSSGKSTLLNTMFGLELAVGAGRCTRGIYAQLLPVAPGSGLPFDYMLVLDSEGLRAHEIGQKLLEHDNELATLVIGLADLTLINMKGENTMEITDVLQIVIHAFIRMRLADTPHKRHCMFLHQNVAAVNAREKLAVDRQKFHEKLNDITKQACEAQGVPNAISTFSQVISFDGEHDVVYFPDLWHGDPPMAVVNQGYANQVSATKQRIVTDTTKILSAGITIQDFVRRVEDMWYGMLTDDFVFSFRNSLAVKMYIDLERKVSQLEMQVEGDILHWANNICNIKLLSCNTEDDLEVLHRKLCDSLRKNMSEILHQNMLALSDFFANHELKEVIHRWMAEKELAFREFGTRVQQHMQIKLNNMKTCKVLDLQSTHRTTEQKITKEATALAEKLHGKCPSEKDLKRKFDDFWGPLTDGLVASSPRKSSNIRRELESLLDAAMAAAGNRKFLADQLKRTPLYPDESMKEITVQDLTEDCIMLTAWASKLKHNKASYFEDAAAKANEILEHVMTQVDQILTQDIMFEPHHAKQIIDVVAERIDSHNKLEDENFSFTAQSMAMLLVHAMCYASAKFTEMNHRFEERHGAQTKLTAYRKRVLCGFKNAVNNASIEVTTSDDFCEAIKVTLVERIRMELDARVQAEVYKAIGSAKYDLIIKILEEIVERKSFEKLLKYIHNPVKYANAWVQEFGGNLIFGKENGQSRYSDFANYFVDKMFAKVRASTRAASERASRHKGPDQYSIWTSEFLQHMRGIIPREATEQPAGGSIKNYENYQKILEANLQRLKKEFAVEFREVSAVSIGWYDVVSPFQKAFERLWGCPELCPFCSEPCQHTDPNHKIPHRCIQHRPPGVLGTSNKDSNVLSMETCSIRVSSPKLVGTNIYGTFNCLACKKQCRKTKHCKMVGNNQDFHSYRDYKKYLPDWDIAPDPADVAPKFWQWVFCNFKRELLQEYPNCKVDVPASWKNTTRKDVISSLKLYAK